MQKRCMGTALRLCGALEAEDGVKKCFPPEKMKRVGYGRGKFMGLLPKRQEIGRKHTGLRDVPQGRHVSNYCYRDFVIQKVAKRNLAG